MSQQSPSESIISLNLQMRKWCLQRFPKAVQLAIIRTQMSSSHSLQESTDHMSQMQGLQRRGACVWTRKLGKWDSAKGTESRLVTYKYPRSRPWIPGNKKKKGEVKAELLSRRAHSLGEVRGAVNQSQNTGKAWICQRMLLRAGSRVGGGS